MDLSSCNFLELQKIFNEIHAKLKAPFPEGTVKHKNDNKKSAYIPYQAYVHRLNSEAGGLWNWTISTTHPIYHEKEKKIEMRGILSILNTTVEGQGYAIHSSPLPEAIKKAVRGAFSDACNMFEMGWIDLDREWAKNPGVGLYGEEEDGDMEGTSRRTCIKCSNVLTKLDEELLKFTNWQQPYCIKDLPKHVKKKVPEEKRAYFGVSDTEEGDKR